MKILHLSTPSSWRGGEQQIAWLMEELREVGEQQLLFCPTTSEMHQYAVRENFQVNTFKKSMAYSPFTLWRLKKICTKEQVSCIHIHDSRALTMAALAASIFQNKTPLVISRRVDFFLRKKRFTSWKYNHSSVKKIVCVSEKVKEIIAPAIMDKSKLSVVYDGIDLQRFSKHDGRLRKEFKIDEDEILIGNIAAIAPHKDYFTFVKTAEILIEKDLKGHFFIIGGDGGEQEKIEHFIKVKGLDKQITLTGFREDIEFILPELDIFLFTSKTEGLGTAVLDALAANVPVVSTKAGGISEYLEHEKNALLGSPEKPRELAENILHLLSQPQLKAKLATKGKETVLRFSKKNMAAKTFAVYQDVLLNII